MGTGSSRMQYYPLTLPRSARLKPTPRPTSAKTPALSQPVTLSAVSLHGRANGTLESSTQDDPRMVKHSHRHTPIQQRLMSRKYRSTPARHRSTAMWMTENPKTDTRTNAIKMHVHGVDNDMTPAIQANGADTDNNDTWTPRPYRADSREDSKKERNAIDNTDNERWTPPPYTNDYNSKLRDVDSVTCTNGVGVGDDDIETPRPYGDNDGILISIYSPHLVSARSGGSWKAGRPPPPTAKPTRNTAKHKQNMDTQSSQNTPKETSQNTHKESSQNTHKESSQNTHKESSQNTHKKSLSSTRKEGELKLPTEINSQKRQKLSEKTGSQHVDMWVNPAYITTATQRYASPSASRTLGNSTRQWTFSSEWF